MPFQAMCFVFVHLRTSLWLVWQLTMWRLSSRWNSVNPTIFVGQHLPLQCVEEKCGILNATVTQRTKFMELIDLEPSVQVI